MHKNTRITWLSLEQQWKVPKLHQCSLILFFKIIVFDSVQRAFPLQSHCITHSKPEMDGREADTSSSQCFKNECYQLIITVTQATWSVQNVTMLKCKSLLWNREHIYRNKVQCFTFSVITFFSPLQPCPHKSSCLRYLSYLCICF